MHLNKLVGPSSQVKCFSPYVLYPRASSMLEGSLQIIDDVRILSVVREPAGRSTQSKSDRPYEATIRQLRQRDNIDLLVVVL